MDNKSINILIAEDNKVNQLLLIKAIKLQGWNVFTAEDGNQVLELYKKNKPDLIIMDIGMPNLNGCDAASQIRSIEKGNQHKTPIIGLTGYTTEEEIAHFNLCGMNEIIPKPFKVENLYSVIRKLISI